MTAATECHNQPSAEIEILLVAGADVIGMSERHRAGALSQAA